MVASMVTFNSRRTIFSNRTDFDSNARHIIQSAVGRRHDPIHMSNSHCSRRHNQETEWQYQRYHQLHHHDQSVDIATDTYISAFGSPYTRYHIRDSVIVDSQQSVSTAATAAYQCPAYKVFLSSPKQDIGIETRDVILSLTVALTLAIAVTTRSLFHTHTTIATQLWLVAISLIACLFQFWIGRRIGAHYNDAVTAGQSLGQKNTVLSIWVGYTFFTPVTAIAGGFYSIWHNLINTYQLRRIRNEE